MFKKFNVFIAMLTTFPTHRQTLNKARQTNHGLIEKYVTQKIEFSDIVPYVTYLML